ncbi:MAG: mannose-1-phosphate guanylyltransferase, partial [Odoribacter sp.]|nr:mannose-1-phosphate guanylyltransferase [Odoribacter sp.]
IFLWNVRTIEQAFRDNLPEVATIFDSLESVYYTADEQAAIGRKFPECPNISIDYAVMEKAENIYVFPASFGWSDLGTWGALYDQVAKDGDANAVVGQQVRMVESRGCIVHVSDDRKMVLQGLEDYIVAEENGVLLICRKADEQRIKEFSVSL